MTQAYEVRQDSRHCFPESSPPSIGIISSERYSEAIRSNQQQPERHQPAMTNPKIPDQSALLYRQGHLTGIPAIPGGTSPIVTELLYLNQYRDTIVSTLPHTNLGHGITSPGQVTEVTYVNAYVASANFRAMLIKHTQPGDDGWTLADIEAFTPGDLTTLRRAPRRATPRTIGAH